jgi:branched-subunit amino acid ABC-type transport system permease component
MLAVSEDKGAAQLMGINVDGTIALTFAIIGEQLFFPVCSVILYFR